VIEDSPSVSMRELIEATGLLLRTMIADLTTAGYAPETVAMNIALGAAHPEPGRP